MKKKHFAPIVVVAIMAAGLSIYFRQTPNTATHRAKEFSVSGTSSMKPSDSQSESPKSPSSDVNLSTSHLEPSPSTRSQSARPNSVEHNPVEEQLQEATFDMTETDAIALALKSIRPETKITNETAVRVELKSGHYIVKFGEPAPEGSLGADFLLRVTINASSGEVTEIRAGT